jgi:hypothetical protein
MQFYATEILAAPLKSMATVHVTLNDSMIPIPGFIQGFSKIAISASVLFS